MIASSDSSNSVVLIMYVVYAHAHVIVNHVDPSTPSKLVPRPTNLPPHFPLIHIPRAPPRLSKLDIAPPHITPPYIAHAPRPTHTPPTSPRLLNVLDSARLRSPTRLDISTRDAQPESIFRLREFQKKDLPVAVVLHIAPLVAVRC